MKNISLPLIIGAVMCVASILFGVNTINSGGTVKGILWMVAALCLSLIHISEPTRP